MRILHVLESFAAGGMETTFLHVLRQFRAADDSIRHDVLAFAGGALEPSYRDTAHAVTIGCDPATLGGHLAQPYDLIHVLFERCAYRLLPQLVARTATPVVYGKGYDMGGMYRLNEGLRWQADESMLMACDGATFTTSHLAAGYDITGARRTVLRKAADVARFQRIPDADAATAARIVCVANLHPRKRLGDLVLALERVRRHVPDAEVRFVGGGSAAEAARLTSLAAGMNLAGAVSLAGGLADVAPDVARARVMALPSSCEGVPTALLEGMAAGRPVVATRVGHVASIVDDGVEGFLVTPGDIGTLAERLTRLLTRPELAASMGQAARTRAAAHDVAVIARTLLDSLREAA
jgi:glycosyltransferase involved in cell wall biosynthesis